MASSRTKIIKVDAHTTIHTNFKKLCADYETNMKARLLKLLIWDIAIWKKTGTDQFAHKVAHPDGLPALIPAGVPDREKLAADSGIDIERINAIASGGMPSTSEVIDLAGALDKDVLELIDLYDDFCCHNYKNGH